MEPEYPEGIILCIPSGLKTPWDPTGGAQVAWDQNGYFVWAAVRTRIGGGKWMDGWHAFIVYFSAVFTQ